MPWLKRPSLPPRMRHFSAFGKIFNDFSLKYALMEVWQWRNMQPPCWTSLKAAPGRALCPTSNRKPPPVRPIPKDSTIRSPLMPPKTCWASWNFPTKKRRPTGSTAASWACSVTAAASSAVTATSPKSSPAWPTSTPCVWPSPLPSTTTPNSCATCATSGTCAVPASPTCTVPPVTSCSWAPRPRSWKRYSTT